MSEERRYPLPTDKVRLEVAEGVATVTFDNPAKRNALDMSMMEGVTVALDLIAGDDAVAVVVVTGAGGRAFVSGADISEFADRRTSVDARQAYGRVAATMMRAWDALDKPVVAMITGYCIGGGLLTAMRADIRVATPQSRFAVPAARLGVGYEYSGVEQLAQLVGPAWAAEILFTGRHLGAEEALRIGLVNRLVADDRIGAEVGELAAAIAANAPLTVRACKAALREWRRPSAQRDLDAVHTMVESCFASSDYVEGQRAFLEKRPPHFTGR